MNTGGAPVTAFFRPSFFSSVEKYGEKKNTASWRFSDSASANCVSSSWIWNLLTAVLTVNLLLVSGLLGRMGVLVGRSALQSLYVAFTLL